MSNPTYCSCIVCHLKISTSSIRAHYHGTHEHVYPKPPRIYGQCKFCGNEIRGYDPKEFCNSKCSSSFNNLRRTSETKEKQKNTLRSTLRLKFPIKNAKVKGERLITRSIISFCVVCGKLIRNSHRKTCSNECLRQRLSESSHPRNKSSVIYNGIVLGSSYELKVAKSLDHNEVEWTRPSPLRYNDLKNKRHYYFPDFFLPRFNIYLDPKNDFLIHNVNPYHGYKDSEKIHWVEEQNNVRIIILDKNQLEWDEIKYLIHFKISE